MDCNCEIGIYACIDFADIMIPGLQRYYLQEKGFVMVGSTQNIHSYQAGRAEHASRSKDIEVIKEVYKESKTAQMAKIMSEVQSVVAAKADESSFEADYQKFQEFLKEVGYEGKPIASLSKEEAAELLSEDGFFGIKKTSERIAQFVISGAGGDEGLLREGRKGILQGLKDAEQMWGGKLPDIAYETVDKAVAMVDKLLVDGGFSILNETA